MVQDQVPIFFDQKAVVVRVSSYHAYVRLEEGDLEGTEHSVFVNAVRVPGDVPVTCLTDDLLTVGQQVGAFYTRVNGCIVMLFLVTEGAKKPSIIEVQNLANDLSDDGSRIRERLVKTINPESGEWTVTPAHLKSAISVPSPIDVKNVLVDQEPRAAADVVGNEDSDASR